MLDLRTTCGSLVRQEMPSFVPPPARVCPMLTSDDHNHPHSIIVTQIPNTSICRLPLPYTSSSTKNMINAVLVFNNAGQPRLTKFYTQLVCSSSSIDSYTTSPSTGNKRPTATNLRNIYVGIESAQFSMQLPTASLSLLYMEFRTDEI